MKSLCAWIVVLLASLCSCTSADRTTTVAAKPEPQSFTEVWTREMSGVQSGCMGLDDQHSHQGSMSAFLQIDEDDFNAMEAFTQHISAANYRGRRIELRADIEANNILPSAARMLPAGAFLEWQIVGVGGIVGRCQSDLISDASSWRSVSVSVDVPQEAQLLTIRAALVGKGKAWVDDIEIVDRGKSARPSLTCVDSVPLREVFGRTVHFQADHQSLRDGGFEERPKFPLPIERRRTCRPELR